MEAIISYVQPFFGWLLQTTLIASVVICLILLIQKLLGGKLGPRWCYALWLVLLIRMVLPWAPSSRLSLFNLIPSFERQIQLRKLSGAPEQHEPSEAAQTSGVIEAIPDQSPEPDVTVEKQTTPKPEMLVNMQKKSKPRLASLRRVLPVLWLAGAVVVGAYLLVSNFALWRIVKQDRPLVNQPMLELFEECKVQIGVQSLVVVVPSDRVRSPSLFGFIRPRLLLPREMLDTATREEMRYVFLHELAHLRRHDIYLGWLASLLQVLHWFNPLIWFAFYRMRADRELACDALVLTRTGQDKSQEYGGAIIGLLRRFSHSRPLPAMAGILENRSQLKRRITMITKFKKNSYQWSPRAAILIVILACISLPDAISTKASGVQDAKPEPKMTVRRVGDWGTTWARISPDGKYLCDLCLSDANNALVARELATGKEHLLVHKVNEGDYIRGASPVISPDSKTVAYRWHDGQEKTFQLQLINLDGSQRRTIQSGENIIPEDWSPDGKRLLALRLDQPHCWENTQFEFVWVSVKDGSVQSITEVPKGRVLALGGDEVALSPDGRFIAYDVEFPQPDGTSKYTIFLFSIEDGSEVRIEHPAQEWLLGWTPDGKYIFFVSDRSGEGERDGWLLPVADGKPQGRARLVCPNIGRISVRAGFTRSGDYYYGTRWAVGNVYTVGVDLKEGKALSGCEPVHPGLYGCPAWSPDGQYLAYYAEGPKNIRIRSLATGEERVLEPNLPKIRWFTWSPDGRSLLACSFWVRWIQKPTTRRVYQIDIKTGQSSVLMETDVGRIVRAELSPDQKSVFYTTGGGELLVRNLETGREKKISEFDPASRDCWDLSPDGKRLVIADADPNSSCQLKIISVKGEQLVELLPQDWNPHHDVYPWFRSVAWAPDGRSVLLSILKDYHRAVLWQISAKGGQPRQIFTTGKLGYWPSGFCVHPDGKLVAFQTTDVQGAGLWVMENFLPEAPVAMPANQPKFTKIRIPNRIHSDAQFSPDGKKIALGFDKKLWIMPRFGTLGPDYPGAPKLLNTGEIEVDWDGFTWSGDGRWIAFNVDGSRIYIISAEGGKPKQVHESDRHVRIVNYRMSLSPHGKTLAFTSNDKGKLHIYTISVDGGQPKQLTDSTAREPVFSPDGKMIAYVEDKNLGIGGGGLWTVPADGGIPALVAKAGNASSPVWSPEGRMIAFLDYAVGNQIYIVPVSEDGKPAGEKVAIDCPKGIKEVIRLTGWTTDNEIGAIFRKQQEFALYTQPVQGGRATFVTHGGYPLQPRWSPDGRQIYHTNRVDEVRGDWQGLAIAHVSAEGGDVTTVPIQSEAKIVIWGYGAGNRVSPDGNTIAFAGRTSQESIGIKHIWTLPIEGGKPKQLTNSPFRDWYPCWSPDGKAIAFLRMLTSKDLVANIYIIPAKGGEPRQLTSESDMVFSASTIEWSPDGKLLAYFCRDEKTAPDGTLKVIPVEGGEPQVVVKVKRIYANKELAWSPDSRQIAFQEANVIKIVSLKAGNVVDIKPDLQDTGVYHLDWSPDGQSLVFAGNKGGGLELWVMENFLPQDMGK